MIENFFQRLDSLVRRLKGAYLRRRDPDLKLAAEIIQGDIGSASCDCDHCNRIEQITLAWKRVVKRYGEEYAEVIDCAYPGYLHR